MYPGRNPTDTQERGTVTSQSVGDSLSSISRTAATLSRRRSPRRRRGARAVRRASASRRSRRWPPCASARPGTWACCCAHRRHPARRRWRGLQAGVRDALPRELSAHLRRAAHRDRRRRRRNAGPAVGIVVQGHVNRGGRGCGRSRGEHTAATVRPCSRGPGVRLASAAAERSCCCRPGCCRRRCRRCCGSCSPRRRARRLEGGSRFLFGERRRRGCLLRSVPLSCSSLPPLASRPLARLGPTPAPQGVVRGCRRCFFCCRRCHRWRACRAEERWCRRRRPPRA